MKKVLVFLFFLTVAGGNLLAQRRINRQDRSGENPVDLLDMPGYKKAPRTFEPFVAGADAAQKGYKADSIYIWMDKAGKRHRAMGADILKQVNDLEKSLCEKGHSLRDKKPFEGLTLQFPSDYFRRNITVPPAFSQNIRNTLPIRINTNRPPRIRLGNLASNMAGYLYPYFGDLDVSNEFPGILYDVYVLTPVAEGANKYIVPLVLPFSSSAFSKLGNCIMEIYSNSSRTGTPLLNVSVNINSPDKMRAWSPQLDFANSANPLPETNGLTMYRYAVEINDVNKAIPTATDEHRYYYIKLKFADKSGSPLLFSFQNEIVLDNTISPPLRIQPVPVIAGISAFNYDVSNQGFGFYIRSNGFKPDTKTVLESRYAEKGFYSFSGDFSVGVKYYNFSHLLNRNEPFSKEEEILNFNFSAYKDFSRPDVKKVPPPIRIPGKKSTPDLMSDPNTKFNITVLKSNLSNYEKYEKSYNVFSQQFSIGPVPCFAEINLIPHVSVSAEGTVLSGDYNNGSFYGGGIKGKIEPVLNVEVEGAGGAGVSGLLWAKVNVGVDLLTLKFPIEFDIKKDKYAKVDASAVISSLSGNVSFDAGFCIPIPFFDDICKGFTIPIASWPSPASATYTLTPSGNFK